MDYDPDHGMLLLSRTPKVLDGWLRGIPEEWVTSNEGPDTWSPYDIVGHLVHGEKEDWLARARIILEQGEGRPFDSFDRFAQFEDSKGKSMDDLLDEFGARREANLAELRNLGITDDDLARTGIHPDFGPVTLRGLLSTWVVHDLSHIAQIARVMGKQYGEEVGPWAEYLPILGPRRS